MGKFKPRVKGQSKGKRWKKGQSSSSNPECRKFRGRGKMGFAHQKSDAHNLTLDSLRLHDVSQPKNLLPYTQQSVISSGTTFDDGESDYDARSTAYSGTSYGTSVQSFASEYSECTNVSFNRFFTVFRSDSALHKEMLAVLAAVTEVIKENGGSETSTEYYCALLTTLEQFYDSEDKKEEQITAVLSLLKMGIGTVPEAVLRKHFEKVSMKMLQILNDYVNKENNAVIRAVFGILATLLRKQELAVWAHDFTTQIFSAMLNPFCIHSKPKWRKAAQNAVTLVVKSPYFESSAQNVAADQVAKFCEQTLSGYLGGGGGGATTTRSVLVSTVQTGQITILHTLGVMKDNICNFSESHIKKCGELILELMILNYPKVTLQGLQVLLALFSSKQAVISNTLNVKLILALYDYRPGRLNVQLNMAWLAVMEQAHIHLADVDQEKFCMLLPKLFKEAIELWLTDQSEIASAVTHSLKNVLKFALAPLCENEEAVKQHALKLGECFGLIESGLSYQYHNIWNQVLHLIETMFEVGGRNCSHMLTNCLKTMAELRDSYKFSYNSELEHAVGAAVRSMGPETVLNVISIKKENGDLNLDRSWMLLVLKENIKRSTLQHFVNGILPLALYCQKRSSDLAEANDGIGAHSYELLYMQLWNLLPCFCSNATDIKTSFKTIAKVLGVAISDRKELRLSVMESLRKLISSAKESKNEEDLAELTRFDKNYLPILFNVYTTKPMGTDEEGQRLAALATIEVYLSIAKPQLTQELLKNAIERLNASSDDPEDPFIKESIFDLIRALVPYQNSENITLIYHQCIKQLTNMKNKKEQKKAYRLLEEICSGKSEICKEFVLANRKDVQRILEKSLESAAVASKGARLRCYTYLIRAQPQLDHESKLLRKVVPEAVLSCKDINEKTRRAAFEVLNAIGETLSAHNQMAQFVTMVIAGLAGTSQLMSCTILTLASILHNFSGELGMDNIRLILENICELLASSTREIVGSCLSFVKVYTKTMDAASVNVSLPILVKALVSMTDDCKRHFRRVVHDILDKLVRKYGYESIIHHIPEKEKIMYKRLRNIRKTIARKRKLKDAKRQEDEEDEDSGDEEFKVKSQPKSVEEILADSDSDLEDDDTRSIKSNKTERKTKKKKTETFIEEDPDTIVDFTDPNVVSKVTASRPLQTAKKPEDKKEDNKKDRGFKTASDGRLIIRDDGERDDTDGDKINLSSDDESDTDDGKTVAETLVMGNRKRKRAASSASVKSGVSQSSSKAAKRYKPGGSGIHRPTSVHGGSTNASLSGNKWKKGKGDAKKKNNQLEPYAYLPLDRSSINKRKKMKAAGQFKHIIKGAQAGSLKGQKAKKIMNKNRKK